MKALKIALTVAIVLAALAVASDAMRLSTLGANDTYDVLRQALVRWLQNFAFIAGAIVFLLWLSRAYDNLDPVEGGHRRYGNGWEIASWFIPILNWYRPPKILNDVVKGSTGGHKTWLVVPWWAAFWIAGIFNTIAALNIDPDYARGATLLSLISDVAIVISGLLLLKITSTATSKLETRAWSKAQSQAPRFDRAPSLIPTEATH